MHKKQAMVKGDSSRKLTMGTLYKPNILEMAIALFEVEGPTMPSTGGGVPTQLSSSVNCSSLPLIIDITAGSATASVIQVS